MGIIESILFKTGYDVAKAFILNMAGDKKEYYSKSIKDFRTIDDRINVNYKAKEKIAKGVVNDIVKKFFDLRDNPILLDTGSVTYYIGMELMNGSDGSIVTNNLTIALEKRKKEHPITLDILYGEKNFDEKNFAFVGFEVAKEAEIQLKKGINNIPKSKIAVLGLRAYNHQLGIMEGTPELTDFQASLFEHAENLIIVAQGEKFLTPSKAPILESDKFKRIMLKRKKEKSIWFVYHEPTCKLTKSQKDYYNQNISDFMENLPTQNIINVTKGAKKNANKV